MQASPLQAKMGLDKHGPYKKKRAACACPYEDKGGRGQARPRVHRGQDPCCRSIARAVNILRMDSLADNRVATDEHSQPASALAVSTGDPAIKHQPERTGQPAGPGHAVHTSGAWPVHSNSADEALAASLTGKHVMFYDGHCKYCHMMAQMCMKGDRDYMVRFAHFQSSFAERELIPRGGYTHDHNKMWLIGSFRTPKEVLLCGPDAALYIQQRIGGFPRFMALMTQWWPTPMRHGMYKFVGKRKDKWFGLYTECKVPSAEQRRWFLD